MVREITVAGDPDIALLTTDGSIGFVADPEGKVTLLDRRVRGCTKTANEHVKVRRVLGGSFSPETRVELRLLVAIIIPRGRREQAREGAMG